MFTLTLVVVRLADVSAIISVCFLVQPAQVVAEWQENVPAVQVGLAAAIAAGLLWVRFLLWICLMVNADILFQNPILITVSFTFSTAPVKFVTHSDQTVTAAITVNPSSSESVVGCLLLVETQMLHTCCVLRRSRLNYRKPSGQRDPSLRRSVRAVHQSERPADHCDHANGQLERVSVRSSSLCLQVSKCSPDATSCPTAPAAASSKSRTWVIPVCCGAGVRRRRAGVLVPPPPVSSLCRCFSSFNFAADTAFALARLRA